MSEQQPWAGYVRRPGATTPPVVPDRRPGSSTSPASSPSLDETLEGAYVRWDSTQIAFDRIQRSSTERSRFRFERALADLVWNAAALEGNTFTLPEVRTLLDGVTIGGRKIQEEEQVLALADGYTHLDALVRDGGFALTKAVSDDLHGRVARHEAIESGAFRGEGVVAGGGAVRLASGGSVDGVPQAELMDRFASIAEFLESLDDARERALGYFAAATRSQFYFDGNKRTARLMMSGLLMSEGYDAVNVPFARQFEFNRALDVLFSDDDATPIMAFLADCADSTPN